MPGATSQPADPAALAERVASLEDELVRWRTLAVTGWADAVALTRYDEDGLERSSEAARLRVELDALHATLSWRITKPLRLGRRVLARVRHPRS